jgi:ParB-like chromosome segregation protein Spo0J
MIPTLVPSDQLVGKFHPLADLFPLMQGSDFAALVADIKAQGQRLPIVLHEGKILDGRSRYRACIQTNVAPVTETYSGTDPLAHVISLNVKRRHLSESQRAVVAAKLATMRQGARTDLAQICAMSQEQAAESLGVSRRLVQHARVVLDRGAPELEQAINLRQLTASAAAEIATALSPHEQAEGFRTARSQGKSVKSILFNLLIEKRNAEISRHNQALCSGCFDVIYADPPWRFDPQATTRVVVPTPQWQSRKFASFPSATA